MAKLTPEQFERKMRRWRREFPDEVYTGLRRGAQVIIGRAQKTYLRGPAPERLRRDTETLARSLTYKMARSPKIKAAVGTNVKYGAVWEKGRRKKGGGLDQRPFLRPAIEHERKRVLEEIARQVVQAYGR